MSFSTLMPGDVLPCVSSDGQNEKWEVVSVNRGDTDLVNIRLRLVPEDYRPQRIDPAELRRKQLFEPHKKIKLEIPEAWLND